MIYCKTCGEPFPSELGNCPRCAAAARRQKATIRWWLSLGAIAFVVLVLWAAPQGVAAILIGVLLVVAVVYFVVGRMRLRK